ncbi:ABC transporter permease [Actinoalloteichus sp. AHMU CJ021]|uniref:Oligopeptide transport system permease protein n=1 Tax=Actinoalloteichus caeruleus DSM 43889 TaxID=1120930 RepID=A0ABT1JIP0_ACTCY|nr:ABC transporter permease [Actinoalloteichus caeruleus]AUS78315.1 ABC transporter permease [Actinoalloteichus sp. AHMU CJ021]MCP2332391.1 oligopeptide transport system permease protein [Actinoalloteichus caeruleus DSM 43889]
MTDPTAAASAGKMETRAQEEITAEGHGARPGGGADDGKQRSLWGDAWVSLRRRPIFIISAVIILFLTVMALFPGLFTSVDPTKADLSLARQTPSADAWFGYDQQGRDIYARVIHGVRASLVVGVLATLGTVLLGSLVGLFAGFYGGWLDAILSRFADVFFGLPFVLGAIVILSTFNPPGTPYGPVRIIFQVIFSIVVLSWPVTMRIMRSAALTAKQQDYVKAARALGASPTRIIFRHLLPNTLAPVLVYGSIALGTYIALEATLSFLGVGLRTPVVSWGVMISDAKELLRIAPHMLLFPAGALAVTVLAFVMLGDAVRDALDPKMR